MSTLRQEAMSLCYFPELLPDELLCSYLARLAAVNGLGTTRFYAYFFGKEGTLPTLDLPTNLASLQLRLDTNSPFDSLDDLLARATLYPYHRTFLSPEKDREIAGALKHGCGSRPKAALGRLANRFGANPALRYCPACVRRDYDHYGTPYWHRVHQLPGVVACVHHDQSLITLTSELNLVHRVQLLLPPLDKCGKHAHHMSKPHHRQKELASLSAQLLQDSPSSQNPEKRAETYQDTALAKGFEVNGRVDYEHLARAIRQYYDSFSSYVHRERLLSTKHTPLAWPRPLFCRPNRSSHPICHLLLIHFLFGSLENFVAALDEHHDTASRQTDNPIQTDHSLREIDLLKDTTRSCTSIAAELGISVTTAVLRRQELNIAVKEKHKTLSPDKVSEVVAALQAEIPVTEVAAKCGVSVSTVYRQRRVNHIPSQGPTAQGFELKRFSRRAEWTRALESNQGCTVKSVRSGKMAVYAWLYRNDRAWLRDSSKMRCYKTARVTIDWLKRDLELCEKLVLYVATLKQANTRTRISRSLMLNHIGEAMLRSSRKKLPKTYALLDKLEESVLSHQKRRIDIAVNHLKSISYPTKLWKVRRLSGIRNWTTTHEIHALNKINNNH